MSITLKIGLVSIPIQLTNVVKNRYTSSPLHLFSTCCSSPVKNKQVCETCNKQLSKGDIKKGISKDIILTDTQLEALKNAEEGGVLSVMSIKEITETTTYDFLPFIQKSQVVLPSIAKGYKKSDIKTFYSFMSALKESHRYAICKLVSRGCEHLGILIQHKDNMMFMEIPFQSYSNIEDIEEQKAMVDKIIKNEKIMDLEGFKEQAGNFINSYKSKVNEVSEITEEKKILLKSYITEIETGIKEISVQTIKEENPFG